LTSARAGPSLPWLGSTRLRCRRRHGNAELKKQLQVLPAAALLLGNLEIPE
jgi:hypothetical protein